MLLLCLSLLTFCVSFSHFELFCGHQEAITSQLPPPPHSGNWSISGGQSDFIVGPVRFSDYLCITLSSIFNVLKDNESRATVISSLSLKGRGQSVFECEGHSGPGPHLAKIQNYIKVKCRSKYWYPCDAEPSPGVGRPLPYAQYLIVPLTVM